MEVTTCITLRLCLRVTNMEVENHLLAEEKWSSFRGHVPLFMIVSGLAPLKARGLGDWVQHLTTPTIADRSPALVQIPRRLLPPQRLLGPELQATEATEASHSCRYILARS